MPNSVSKGFDTAIRKQCQNLCLLSLAFIIDGRVVKLIKRNRKNSFFANIFIFMVLPGSLFEVVVAADDLPREAGCRGVGPLVTFAGHLK